MVRSIDFVPWVHWELIGELKQGSYMNWKLHELSKDHSGCSWENRLERPERNWMTGPRIDLKYWPVCVCACACVRVVWVCMYICVWATHSIHFLEFYKLDFLRFFSLLRKIIPLRKSCTSYWEVWQSREEAAQGTWKHYWMFGRLSKYAHWKAEVNFWAFGTHLSWREICILYEVERCRGLSS